MTPYRLRAVLLAGVLPLLVALAAAGLMLSWQAELPDPIAIHWSSAEPDGFGPLWGNVLLVIGLSVGFAVFALLAAWTPQATGRPSASQKILLATSPWLAVFIGVLVTGSVWMQRGLADAAEAGDVVGWIPVGLLAGFVVAALVWFLLPKADVAGDRGTAAEPIAAAPGERMMWSRTVRISRGLWVLIGSAIAAALLAVLITAISARQGLAFAAVALAAVVLLALCTTVWRVTADARGLLVRSALGWPRKRIRAADIAEVHVVQVNPSADFGGWGWRWAPGRRSGVVMRAGEAIEVTHRDGSRFVVTVDDAATGAGVLEALRTRA